jgi:DNA primase
LGDYQAIAPKYIIRTSFEIEGVVEKSDVVGALFGQTEGLFGPEFDLRELQKTGRIGRIEIELESKQDKTKGKIIIPSSLDKASTALIAASVESVNRIGPCLSKVKLERIEDVREVKRDEIVSRAKKILQNWTIEASPSTEKILDEVLESIRPVEVTEYGKEKLSAGPDINSSKSLIIVEGRSDIANLLKSGIYNVIASEGAKIPKTIIQLSKKKNLTAFLDGDRGGDLILKGLMQVAEVKYVARAPRGKEVEDLTSAEIREALNKRLSIKKKEVSKKKRVKRVRTQIRQAEISISKSIENVISGIKGTLEAVLLDKDEKQVERMPVSELCDRLKENDAIHTIVFDGVITQRLVDIAVDKGVEKVIGERISGVTKRPVKIQLITSNNIT